VHHLGRANRYDLTDIAISPNGTIWVATFNAGVFMLAPNGSDWVHFTESQGLVGNQVRSITVDGDSSIWFATSAGASHFDGHAWTSYTAADGLLPADISGIAVDSDLVWFATYAGASMLDTTTGTWRSFTKTEGLPDDFLNAVGLSKDGSVWFAGMDNLWRLRWPDRPAGTPSWSHYEGWVDNIKSGPNDTLWFVGFNGVQSYDPQTDSLQDHTQELSKIGLKSAVHSITFAPDDSMWLGSETSNEIFHVLRDPNTQSMTVRSYDSRDGLPKEATRDDNVEALAFAPDGSFWISTQEDATHCSFPK
jgi:ligand-binding sensor domain-containing protein